MRIRLAKNPICILAISVLYGTGLAHSATAATDKLNAIYTARVMSQAMPWIAQETGLFKKYELDVQLIYVLAGAPAVATILAGDSELTQQGAAGLTRAFVQGNTQQGAAGLTRAFVQGNRDIVFIGGIKNILAHSVLAKPEIKSPEQLRGKKIGVTRNGGDRL